MSDVGETIERAEAELKRLCHGGRWIMCVPARPTLDSDLIFAEVIAALRASQATVRGRDSM